jgi:hypothetical protein
VRFVDVLVSKQGTTPQSDAFSSHKSTVHVEQAAMSAESQATHVRVVSGLTQSHAVRLPPGADLVPALLQAARQAMTNAQTESAFVMTSVGSLSQVGFIVSPRGQTTSMGAGLELLH